MKTLTLADQFTAKKKTWKAYIEGSDKGPKGQPTTCRHPKLGAADADLLPRPKDGYVTWSDPFVYFGSLSKACSRQVVGLDHIASDLKSAGKAPTFAFIAPDACHDGSDQSCAPKAKAGVATADGFLRALIPQIESSAAYRDNGLIAITFDEAPQTGPHADQGSCCNTPEYPNLHRTATSAASTTTATTTTAVSSGITTPMPAVLDPAGSTPTTPTPAVLDPAGSTPTTPTTTTTTATAPPTTTTGTTTTTAMTTTTTPASIGTGVTSPTGGGGQVGLLLISSFIKPGSTDVVDYFNHFSLLASIEELFSLRRLAYGSDSQLAVFDASIFNKQ